MIIQSDNNNLNYLIDPTFTQVNRLFVLWFKRINKISVKKGYRDSFSDYYFTNIKIKDFNVLIDGKSFFDLPEKIKKKLTRKLLKWVRVMTTRLVFYWIIRFYLFQRKLQINFNWFE